MTEGFTAAPPDLIDGAIEIESTSPSVGMHKEGLANKEKNIHAPPPTSPPAIVHVSYSSSYSYCCSATACP
jgi:hypothetical protein